MAVVVSDADTDPGTSTTVPKTQDRAPQSDPLAAGQDRMLAGAEDFERRYEDYTRKEQQSAADMPPLPKLGKVGAPPQNDIRGDAMAWLGFATALGGIAGLMTKRNSMNALAAFSGTLDGLREGNQQKFNDSFKIWEAQAKATQENNRTEMDGYRNILERKDLDHRQRAEQLEMWATQNRNQFMIEIARHAKETGDFTTMGAAVDSIRTHLDKGETAYERLTQTRALAQERADYAKQQRQEKAEESRGMIRDVLGDMATGKQAPLLTGIYGQNRLIAEQEAAKQGINLAQLQLQWRAAENLNRSLSSNQRANMFAYGERFNAQTVPRLKELSDKLNLNSMPLLNWGQLLALQNQTGPRAQLAAQYVAQMKIAQEDISQLVRAGYAPTNMSLEFAQQQINENMSVKNLQAALEEEQRGVAYTINAFSSQGAGVMGPTAPNPYLGGRPPIDVSQSGRLPAEPAPATADIPAKAIEKLRANPGMRQQFDDWYGPGQAAKILGGQ